MSGAFPMRSILVTDYGNAVVPEEVAGLYEVVRKTAFRLPDQRTRLGRDLMAWEARQLRRINEAGCVVELEPTLSAAA